MPEAVENEKAAKQEGEERLPIKLNGAFRFKVDAKGRVSLPAKFRKVVSSQLTIARQPKDECLYVFEAPDYEAWVETLFTSQFGGFDPASTMHQHLLVGLKGMANDVEVDSAGRIMLPAESRERVGIDKDVVIVGSDGRFEIWDADRYKETVEGLDFSVFFHA